MPPGAAPGICPPLGGCWFALPAEPPGAWPWAPPLVPLPWPAVPDPDAPDPDAPDPDVPDPDVPDPDAPAELVVPPDVPFVPEPEVPEPGICMPGPI